MVERLVSVPAGDFLVTETGLVKNSAGGALAINLNSNGYERVCGSVVREDRHGYKTKHVFVHHLVALAFLGARLAGQVVNHIDHNPRNNHASNLEYISQSENLKHHWRAFSDRVRRGRKHATAKFSIEKLEEALSLNGLMSTRKAAALTGISKSHVALLWAGGVNL